MGIVSIILTLFPYIVQAWAFLLTPPLWMRTCLVLGFTLELLYWVYVPREVQYIHVAGAGMLLLINVAQAIALYRKRYDDSWSDEERYLQSTAFRSLPNAVFKKLMAIAEWKTVHKGEVLITEHDDVEHLMLIYDGTAVVYLQNQAIAYLRDNNFVGEMSFLTGNPASATVRAATTMRLVMWRKNDLYDLMLKEPELKTGLQTLFSYDLANKLSKYNTHHSQENV
ncbi:MAG: cyclic nucleotide-binding domain-containing protein [Bacteroidota bacterium]|nr:cyclic nucleotide-binding domain-containing protein [Candidatus Kapabacteria bacterium]MDW8219620.1 cyclic nucleotide-binding domain-containing protein [Bacteroidota bacterium]